MPYFRRTSRHVQKNTKGGNEPGIKQAGLGSIVGFHFTAPARNRMTNTLYVKLDVVETILKRTGIALIDISGNSYDGATSLQLDGLGNIYVGGVSDANGSLDFAVVKLNSTGSLDTSFGNAGITLIDISGNSRDTAFALQLDSSGNIYVGGFSNANGSDDIAVVKLNSLGSLDSSFGNAGIALIDISGNSGDAAFALQLDSSGNIYVGGFSDANGSDDIAVVKLQPNGSLDTSFGNAGIALIGVSGDGATSLQLDGLGNIYVGGVSDANGSNDFAVVKLNSTGSLDSSFGNAGIALIDISNDIASTLQLDGLGNIYVGGFSNANGSLDFAIVKLQPNGSLDTSFGNAGIALIDISGNSDDAAFALQLDGLGNIYVGGVSDANGSFDGVGDCTVVKLQPNGSLDTSFGNAGIALIDINFIITDSLVGSLQLDSSGNIYVGGIRFVEETSDDSLDFVVIKLQPNGSLDTSFGDLI